MQEDGTEANKIMGIKDGLRNIRWVTLVKFASMALFGAWSLGFAWVLLAQPAGQKTFSSPDEASRALIRAGSEVNVTLCRTTGDFFREWGLPGSRFVGPEELPMEEYK